MFPTTTQFSVLFTGFFKCRREISEKIGSDKVKKHFDRKVYAPHWHDHLGYRGPYLGHAEQMIHDKNLNLTAQLNFGLSCTFDASV